MQTVGAIIIKKLYFPLKAQSFSNESYSTACLPPFLHYFEPVLEMLGTFYTSTTLFQRCRLGLALI